MRPRVNSHAAPSCRYGKIGFGSERAALRYAATMKRYTSNAPSFAYRCESCAEWHLTQQSPQNRRLRAKKAYRAVGHRVDFDPRDAEGFGR